MTRLAEIIEAVLLISAKQIEVAYIQDKLGADNKDMQEAIDTLKHKYSAEESGINLLSFNGKLQLCTSPSVSKEVEAVLNPIRQKELSNSMLETLAIVAYKQPITRLEVEEIRGVDSTYSIQCLIKTGMMVAVGRKDAIGKPILFGTTDEFLKRFSLSSIKDLPEYDVFLERLKTIGTDTSSVQIVEEPLFNSANGEEVPDFLKDEDVQIVD